MIAFKVCTRQIRRGEMFLLARLTLRMLSFFVLDSGLKLLHAFGCAQQNFNVGFLCFVFMFFPVKLKSG